MIILLIYTCMIKIFLDRMFLDRKRKGKQLGNITDDKIRQIAFRLRKIRELKGMTREAFCEPLYENSEYWGMIERGEQSISLAKLLQVCEVYHIPIEDLVDLNYSPQEDSNIRSEIITLLDHCHGKQLDVIRKFIADIALAL